MAIQWLCMKQKWYCSTMTVLIVQSSGPKVVTIQYFDKIMDSLLYEPIHTIAINCSAMVPDQNQCANISRPLSNTCFKFILFQLPVMQSANSISITSIMYQTVFSIRGSGSIGQIPKTTSRDLSHLFCILQPLPVRRKTNV